jgi:hypothetical protein
MLVIENFFKLYKTLGLISAQERERERETERKTERDREIRKEGRKRKEGGRAGQDRD